MKLYQEYLLEKDKIHPGLKNAGSWFAATPASDVATAAITGGAAYKAGKALGKSGKVIAKDVVMHAGKGALMSLGVYTLFRALRAMFDKCELKCGLIEINTPKRQFCKLMCKKGFLQSTINELNKVKNKETDSKKINNIKLKINKLNNKLTGINKKIIMYKEYMSKKGIKDYESMKKVNIK
jgi:hypothetical protein